MLNNDILRRFRYALDISDLKMIESFKLGGYQIDKTKLIDILKKVGLEDIFKADFYFSGIRLIRLLRRLI